MVAGVIPEQLFHDVLNLLGFRPGEEPGQVSQAVIAAWDGGYRSRLGLADAARHIIQFRKPDQGDLPI